MKAPFLSKILRITFAVLEAIVLLVTVLAITAVFLFPRLPAKTWFGLGPIQFEQVGVSYPLSIPNIGDFEIRNLQATVVVTRQLAEARFATLGRAMLPVILVHGLFFYALFDLLRRLFRNVGRRESFSDQNIRLVRGVGISIIAFTLLAAVGKMYFSYRELDYLGNSGTLMGAEVRLAPATEDNALF